VTLALLIPAIVVPIPLVRVCVTLDTAESSAEPRAVDRSGCKQTVRWVADVSATLCKWGISWFLWDRRVIESGKEYLEFKEDRTVPAESGNYLPPSFEIPGCR